MEPVATTTTSLNPQRQQDSLQISILLSFSSGGACKHFYSAMAEVKSQGSSLCYEEKEVKYSDGATPLFLAIEEHEWRTALDIVEEHPEQVRTWVRSTGTENTTFTWSMWRRLPIHEACRRQAPAWLVSSLFSAFPESAYLTTQFGELPLHLAVESGAAPEVVNLTMVANWGAIVTPDNSGRIPTDILDRGELLLLDDHRIVHESLLRCHRGYIDMQKAAQEEQDNLREKHKEKMIAVHRQHQEVLKKEQDKQEEIRMEVSSLKIQIERMKETQSEKERLLAESQRETRAWKDEVLSLQSTIEQLRHQLMEEKQKVASLTEELEDRDEDISHRDEFIDCLSNDLRAVCLMHDEELMESVRNAEKNMRAMVSSQIALQKQLAGQTSGIKALLKSRGIDLPSISASSSFGPSEKATQNEEKVDPNDVANALAAAAMAALKPY